MGRARSALAAAIAAFVAVSMPTPASAAVTTDAPDGLGGTWGLAPIDRQPGVSGSYLAVYRGDEGKIHADLSANPTGWHCTLDGKQVAWNAQRSRFEWPNESTDGKGTPCWMTAAPKGDKLDLTIWCPYNCTDGEGPHELTLERIANVRLVPPVDTVKTFCSTHDALRQQFCLSGAVRDAVARVRHAEKQRSVLSDEDEVVPDTDETMLSVLEGCHVRGGDGDCLLRELESRARQLESGVAGRQASLAKERRASEASATTVARLEQRKAWEGEWFNDLLVGTLTIAGCDERGCTVSVDGETNYQWGSSGRSGGCFLDDVVMRYVDPKRGFAYLEPGEDDADAEGAGSFANFCRLDLERFEDGVRVRLRGTGCQRRCSEAKGRGLRGDYHPIQKPSFPCHLDEEGGMGLSAAWDEVLICLDPELAQVDRELASAFEKAKGAATGPSREKLVRAQRAWLRSRKEECDHGERRTCLVAACRKRLRELTTP